MRIYFAPILAAFLLVFQVLPLPAEPGLHNGDLKDGIAGWHGDGQLVYLNPDGTEAADASGGAVPVLKLHLSSSAQVISQDYETRGTPSTQDLSVQVMPSADFKRSADPSVYTERGDPGSRWHSSRIKIFAVDFWIRSTSGGREWDYILSDPLKAGTWTTVEGRFENLDPSENHGVFFCVPPGTGSVYIKNALAAP